MRWVKPTLAAHIRFVGWTAEGHLRHAAFLGLRTDKAATKVRREWGFPVTSRAYTLAGGDHAPLERTDDNRHRAFCAPPNR